METAFLKQDGDIYVANAPARGPWDPDLCHAGPVAGAIAREIEHVMPTKQLVRLTIELNRPVPMAGFRIAAHITKEGRRVGAARADLTDLSGRLCATATATLILPGDLGPVPTAAFATDSPEQADDLGFPITATLHDLPSFRNFVEVAYPPGETPTPGATKMWMRAPALIDGEAPSPFQRICALADCGNAISRNAELDEFEFMNADLTITLHRPSPAEWFLSDSISHWQSSGIGLAHAHLSDEEGPVGTALQTLLLVRK